MLMSRKMSKRMASQSWKEIISSSREATKESQTKKKIKLKARRTAMRKKRMKKLTMVNSLMRMHKHSTLARPTPAGQSNMKMKEWIDKMTKWKFEVHIFINLYFIDVLTIY